MPEFFIKFGYDYRLDTIIADTAFHQEHFYSMSVNFMTKGSTSAAVWKGN